MIKLNKRLIMGFHEAAGLYSAYIELHLDGGMGCCHCPAFNMVFASNNLDNFLLRLRKHYENAGLTVKDLEEAKK